MYTSFSVLALGPVSRFSFLVLQFGSVQLPDKQIVTYYNKADSSEATLESYIVGTINSHFCFMSKSCYRTS